MKKLLMTTTFFLSLALGAFAAKPAAEETVKTEIVNTDAKTEADAKANAKADTTAEAKAKAADKTAAKDKAEAKTDAKGDAADKHDHDHTKIVAGPTGGRVITAVEPHAEFFVNKDNKVEIRFVDDDMKVVAPAEQTVTVTLGDRSAPTKLAFAKEGDMLVSDKAIPKGNDLPTVVQIKTKAGEKSVTEKFNLNLEQCPTCKNKEYACTCDHGDDKKDEKKAK